MQPSVTSTGGARPGWLRAIAVQCLALLVTLAACEAILRVIDLRYLRMDESGVAPVYAHDAELGWYPIPNSAQTYSGARTVHVRHNSIGLRDIEPEATPKPTIAFVGDSFVWGYDAEESERFTNILRDRLPAYRVANVGVTAYGTDQQYLLLGRVWDRIKPNIVVLMVCVDNDRIENSTNQRYDGPYKPYFDLAMTASPTASRCAISCFRFGPTRLEISAHHVGDSLARYAAENARQAFHTADDRASDHDCHCDPCGVRGDLALDRSALSAHVSRRRGSRLQS